MSLRECVGDVFLDAARTFYGLRWVTFVELLEESNKMSIDADDFLLFVKSDGVCGELTRFLRD